MKISTRPQFYRARRILEMIRSGTQTGKLPNSTDFRKELEVSWITIMRDMDLLRDDLGAPIEYDASQRGFRLADQTWNLPPVELNRNEIFAFSIAQKLLAGFRGTALEMDMQSLLKKIAESLEGKITVDPVALTERFTVLGDDYVEQDPETWTAVAKHVDRQETVCAVYQRFDGTVKTYTLMPLHLVYHHGNWYVLACPDPSSRKRFAATGGRERMLTFALSRMREIEGTGEHFEVPEWFNLKKHLDESFGIVRGEEVFRVRLLFSRKIATYIRERTWHPSQEVLERKNGDLELRFKTAGWKELVRWILSWQPDVKVLAPKTLRERVEFKMKQALGLEQNY